MDHKYEEALERAKQGLPIDDVFPELKQSEDERIREELIGHCKDLVRMNQDDKVMLSVYEPWLVWLERQKEQKPAKDTALQEAFINSKIDYTLEEKCDASDYAEIILPTSVIYGENKEEYKLHKIIEAAFIAGQKKEQNPEWSEEDEMMLNAIIGGLGCIQKAGCERFGGEEMSDVILWIKNRFKSLRPQPHWKPSEEQMKALKLAYEDAFDCPEGGVPHLPLQSLYQDLQKLL